MTDLDIEEIQVNEIDINYHLYESLKETFEQELKKIFRDITQKYGEKYIFKQEDLLKFYKKHTLELFYKKSSYKKPKNIVNPPDEIRCCARVWANGYMEGNQFGDRCQRKRIEKSDYCRQHTYHLTHGRFDNNPSSIVKGFYVKQNDKSYDNNSDTE